MMLNINVAIEKNEKFTTANLGCFLRFPLTKHNLAYASLLAKMQMNASLFFPRISRQETAFKNLYDIQFEVVPQLFGKEIVLSYIANFVEPTELLDPDYNYKKVISILEKVILHPSFNDKLIELSKEQLISEYDEIMKRPATFAFDKFFKIWYQDDPDFSDSFIGSIEEIKRSTSSSLTNFYKNLRDVPLSIIGMAKDNRQLEHIIKSGFKHAGLMKKFGVDGIAIPAKKREISKVDDHHNLQAQLMLGYAYNQNIKISFEDQICGLVLAEYLAGDQSSILFRKVREELGAAYSVSADNYANNSLFLINAGIEPAMSEKVQRVINNELQKVADGEINLELLQLAKTSLINVETVNRDRESWILAQLLREHLFAKYREFDRLAAIKAIGPEQIESFAKNLYLNESYVLK